MGKALFCFIITTQFMLIHFFPSTSTSYPAMYLLSDAADPAMVAVVSVSSVALVLEINEGFCLSPILSKA
jgi:hypothetical protein